MPYHGPVTSTRTSTGIFDYSTVSDYDSLPFGPRGSIKRTYDNIVFHSSRTGTNSPPEDLIRQYGAEQLELVARRYTVGYEYRVSKVEVTYKDRRGRLRSRVKRVIKRVPIKVRYSTFKVKKGAKNREPDVFLKPNFLDYRCAFTFTAPSSLRVYFNKPSASSYSYRGYCDVNGPGSFDSYPLYYGPVINFGFPIQSLPFGVATDGPQFDAALRKLYQKVYSDIPDYYTAAAESPELLHLIRQTAKEGLKLAKEIYRLDLKRLAGRLNSNIKAKDLAGLWLGWIYGIVPTVQDIEDTVRVISREERVWRTFSASERIEHITDDSDSQDISLAGHQRYEETYIARYGVILEGKVNITKYLMRASHWQQSVGTLVEVIPFSFMLDWLIDITGYLKACTILDKLQYSAWRTSSKKIERAFDGRFAANPEYPTFGTYSSEPFSARSTVFQVKRDVLSSLPEMPLPVLEKPALDTTNLQRAINAFAILVARR